MSTEPRPVRATIDNPDAEELGDNLFEADAAIHAAAAPMRAVTVDEARAIVRDIDKRPPAHTIRPLPVEEGFRRLAQRRFLAAQGLAVPAGTPGDEEKRQREAREADVVDAARRSQAEIRRHVDSYLKEHFENISADVASVVVDVVHERILKGVAAMQEQQVIALDRIASDVRAQFRAFAKEAWGPAPAKQARRAPKGTRRAKHRT